MCILFFLFINNQFVGWGLDLRKFQFQAACKSNHKFHRLNLFRIMLRRMQTLHNFAANLIQFRQTCCAWKRNVRLPRPSNPPTLPHQHNAVRHQQRFINIMRNHHRRRVVVRHNFAQHRLHLLTNHGIKRGKWLVQQQHLRLAHNATRQRRLLRHARLTIQTEIYPPRVPIRLLLMHHQYVDFAHLC